MKSDNKTFKIFFVFLIIFSIFLVCLIALPFVICSLGLESRPLVTHEKQLTFEDVKRIRSLLRENNPRRLQPGEIKETWITERDLNLLMYYGLSHSPFKMRLDTRVRLGAGTANVQVTCEVPKNPFGEYLNVVAKISESADVVPIALDKIKFGDILIPRWLFLPLYRYAGRRFKDHEIYQSVMQGMDAIKEIRFHPEKMFIVYQWREGMTKDLQHRGRDFLLPVEQRKRLLAYYDQLTAIFREMNQSNMSLAEILQPVFTMVRERTLSGGDPVEENRAAILSLAVYSVGANMDKIVDRPKPVGSLTLSAGDGEGQISSIEAGERQKKPKRVNLTLLERGDLTKHFLVSAAITVSAGGGMADLLGIYKEISDSSGGSGFSFADLAADRAGVKFGEVAISSSLSANIFQGQMNMTLTEMDIMPKVTNLPEGIMELEFKKRYRDLDSETYKMVDDEIERRLAECRVYK